MRRSISGDQEEEGRTIQEMEESDSHLVLGQRSLSIASHEQIIALFPDNISQHKHNIQASSIIKWRKGVYVILKLVISFRVLIHVLIKITVSTECLKSQPNCYQLGML